MAKTRKRLSSFTLFCLSTVVFVYAVPAAMARDLNILCVQGVFKLAQVVPLDMFPQTQHVECLAELRSRSTSNEHS